MDWTEQYEALRAHAVGEAPVGFVPLGLGVLHRRGVAGWMAVEWGAEVERAPAGEQRIDGRGERRGVDVSPFKLELVQLLATAALTLSQGRAT